MEKNRKMVGKCGSFVLVKGTFSTYDHQITTIHSLEMASDAGRWSYLSGTVEWDYGDGEVHLPRITECFTF